MANTSLFRKISFETARSFLQKEKEPAAPARFSAPVRFPYGAFQFKMTIGKGIDFEIQAGNDFKTWARVDSGTSKGEVIDYLDSSASKFSYRFYRIMEEGRTRSTNVIGYVTVTVPPGYSMVGNPLNATSNAVPDLFKGFPNGTVVSKFNARVFGLNENQLSNNKWANPYETLAPGEGAIVFNPTTDYKMLNFVGEVMEDDYSLPIPAGFSVRSALAPLPGRVHEDLGFPASEGDVIHLFDTNKQQYVLYPFNDKEKWAANPPVVSVGEAFWVEKTAPKSWHRANLRKLEIA